MMQLAGRGLASIAVGSAAVVTLVLRRVRRRIRRRVQGRGTITVNRPVSVVYQAWRDMVAGTEIAEDTPGRLIRWRATDTAEVAHDGAVRFSPAPRGNATEIALEVGYDLPGGCLTAVAGGLFGEAPGQQTKDALRRFKQRLETGEVVRSDGAPDGPDTPGLQRQRPAQPIGAGGIR